MSAVLLTPGSEPISPIDPYMSTLARAPSQSTEFFNAVFVDSRSGAGVAGADESGGRGGTRPMRVKKKIQNGESSHIEYGVQNLANESRK